MSKVPHGRTSSQYLRKVGHRHAAKLRLVLISVVEIGRERQGSEDERQECGDDQADEQQRPNAEGDAEKRAD